MARAYPEKVPETEWTVATLKEHVLRVINDLDERNEQRFADSKEAVTAALTAAKEAVGKAEIAAEKRFDATNEFRGQLSDQAATFMPRAEADLEHNQTTSRLNAIEARLNAADGRTHGVHDSWGYVVGAVGVLAGVVAVVSRFVP